MGTFGGDELNLVAGSIALSAAPEQCLPVSPFS